MPSEHFEGAFPRKSNQSHLAKTFSCVLCMMFILVAVPFVPRVSAAKDATPTNLKGQPTATQTVATASTAQQTPAPTGCDKAAAVDSLAKQQGNSGERDKMLIDVFCILAGVLVLYPLGRFLFRQWAFRTDRLFGALAKDAIVYYYKQFRPSADVLHLHPPKEIEPQEREDSDGDRIFPEDVSKAYMRSFKKDFYHWYGRKYYAAPAALLVLLTAAGVWWAELTLRGWAVNGTGPGSDLRALVASALAGAFVWVIADELDRLRRRDYTTSDVYYYVFRILLAIPFAWAISAVNFGTGEGGLHMAIPVAFFLGAFPTQTLFKIARRIGSQQLKLGDDQDTGKLELEGLQAVGKANAERFKDEGITTIVDLAYADPIDITIRTNFDLSYVVDCVSQALAWIYFGKNENYEHLFGLSLRGAQEIYSVILDASSVLDTSDPNFDIQLEKQARALQTILDAAGDLKIPPDAFRSSLDQIAEDPYTKFLVNVWC